MVEVLALLFYDAISFILSHYDADNFCSIGKN